MENELILLRMHCRTNLCDYNGGETTNPHRVTASSLGATIVGHSCGQDTRGIRLMPLVFRSSAFCSISCTGLLICAATLYATSSTKFPPLRASSWSTWRCTAPLPLFTPSSPCYVSGCNHSFRNRTLQTCKPAAHLQSRERART